MKKATRIISEVEYTNENGDSVHSDLDFDFDLKEQMRPVLHECLDEWLDKSNGSGGFYLRNTNHHFEDYDEGQPKRNPLPDGTLELTEEELGEFCKMMGYLDINKITIDDNLCFRCYEYGWRIVTNIRAILWLADRFNLEGNNDIQSR